MDLLSLQYAKKLAIYDSHFFHKNLTSFLCEFSPVVIFHQYLSIKIVLSLAISIDYSISSGCTLFVSVSVTTFV